MTLHFYDPVPFANEYASKLFFVAMRAYAKNNGIETRECADLLALPKNATVVLCTDHLTDGRIVALKTGGVKIIGLNVTDSSYISGPIRYAPNLQLVDHIFMLSGLPVVNESIDIAIDNDFKITQFKKPFLDEDAWRIFDYMRRSGRLHSLPYVPWTPIPETTRVPWGQRSQKAIIRGGGHSRRFILGLFLAQMDRLDPNSGFVLYPYFEQGMNPAFRYCDDCRADYEEYHRARHLPPHEHCNSPARASDDEPQFYDMHDLGQWNNRCPRSFFWMAEQFSKAYGQVDMAIIEKILNARWLHPKEHMEMLGRILFTSDFKWLHSIYAPQRYWEAASAGCINVLPSRTMDQEYFPVIRPGEHYLVYEETMENLELAFTLGESAYNEMAAANRQLYEQWIAPSIYPINTNLLTHMFQIIQQ